MDFSDAFNRMKHGHKRVSRPGWTKSIEWGETYLMARYLGDSQAMDTWHPEPEDLVATDWELYFGNS